MKNHKVPQNITRFSLMILAVILTLCFTSCFGIGGSDNSGSGSEGNSGSGSEGNSILDLTQKNTLQEGKKYFFESAEISIQMPSYREYSDSMSERQFDALKEEIETKFQEDLQSEIEEQVFYTVAEDGSYVKHSYSFYIFEGGKVYLGWLEGVGESIGTHNGSEVYSDYTDLWDELGGAEGFEGAIWGTYDGNKINFEVDARAEISNGKLIVQKREDIVFIIEYTVYYRYYYTVID